MSGKPGLLVVGAGRMGVQIAVDAARRGLTPTVVTPRPGVAAETVASAAARLRDLGALPDRTVAEVVAAIGVAGSLADVSTTVRVDMVIESVPERRDLKVAVLSEAASRFPDATLASNTSSLPIVVLGRAAHAEERLVGMHFLNPPTLLHLVELTRGKADDRAWNVALAVAAALGKRPIVVGHHVPGFVWNRLQFAVLREAAWLIEHGVATREDVDLVMREGLAPRYIATGPLETVAVGGVDTFANAARAILPTLSGARHLDGLDALIADLDGEARTALLARRDAALARRAASSAADQSGSTQSHGRVAARTAGTK